MKFVWFVFHYDSPRVFNLTGRLDDRDNSHADISFKYTTASVKQFLRHNPEFLNDIIIYTDDPDRIKNELIIHGVAKSSSPGEVDVKIKNISSDIEEWKKHDYPWYPKTRFLIKLQELNESIFYMDSDCICKKSIAPLIPQIEKGDSVVFWEAERQLPNTRPYWGWQAAADLLGRPYSYWVYNDGIIGLSKKNISKGIFEASHDICVKVWEGVDLTKIPGRPHDYPPKKVFISQQLALCFACQDSGLNLLESKDFFYHFYSDKRKCLDFL